MRPSSPQTSSAACPLSSPPLIRYGYDRTLAKNEGAQGDLLPLELPHVKRESVTTERTADAQEPGLGEA